MLVIINTLYLFCVLWFTSSGNCRVHESKFWGLTCLSLKLWHLEQILAHDRHSVNIF